MRDRPELSAWGLAGLTAGENNQLSNDIAGFLFILDGGDGL